MIKICHLTSVHNAKDTRIFQKECRSLAQAGYDVKLIVVNAVDVSFDVENLEIINVPFKAKNRFHRILNAHKAVLKEALKQEAAIYHFHDPELLLIARRLKRTGAKVIYDAHEDVPKQILTKSWIPSLVRNTLSAATKWYENRTIKKIDAVVTVVEGISKRVDKLGVTCELVKNFPDVKSLPEPASWVDKEASVCYVGDFTRIRGIAELVDAVAISKTKLVLAGRWSDEKLKSEVVESKGWSYVDFKGFVNKEQVQSIYATSSVGVVLFHPAPNHLDALPNKLFEYLAAGIPVIASNFGWLQQIVSEFNCGLNVDPMDRDAIAKAISYLLENKEESMEMGRRGRQAVLNTFNWETEQTKLLSLYSNLLKE